MHWTEFVGASIAGIVVCVLIATADGEATPTYGDVPIGEPVGAACILYEDDTLNDLVWTITSLDKVDAEWVIEEALDRLNVRKKI